MRARMSLRKSAAKGILGMQAVEAYVGSTTLPHAVRELVKLRVSQINGCGFCVDMHAKDAQRAGETDERLFSVAAWREAPYFTDAERAALALAESATRIADNPEGVPTEVWDEAARHFDEEQLAGLVVAIAAINAWNRMNVTLRQPAGAAM
ncbi:carboxymuconolactone decarboxylase family protein [Streptomyces hainanensis]|uniref:Carboxymuconolactone decarboxylase family protein n=1 Tax=Streptomyces hainanensis TaxID=402648 RepID=A0A4R4TZC4_9ACTN|nr:carboxymuconolactone decarboxylase family protein [Streptomyces hainanensis]TDC79569.1 carboxymuconolactone decarboxylase family protein [Streptomyces hainanensis]